MLKCISPKYRRYVVLNVEDISISKTDIHDGVYRRKI